MRYKNVYLLFAAALILIAGVLYYFSNKSSKENSSEAVFSKAASNPSSGNQQSHEKHKENVEDSSAKADSESPKIEISPEKQQLIGVKTTQASIKPLQKVLRTVGRIEFDEQRVASINTVFEGWIQRLYADYTGKYVKKGEILAEIYSPEFVSSQQEMLSVLKWLKQSRELKSDDINKMLLNDADLIARAAKQRLKIWGITDEQINRIEKSGRAMQTFSVSSPLNGYVVQKMVVQGTRVMPGEKIFDIADLSTVWIVADIYEYDLPLIKVGEPAKIRLSYFPDREYSSFIDYIYPSLSAETRTARVRFTLPNSDGQLKPQMFTNVEIMIGLGKRLLIPKDAIIDTGIRKVVYVDKGEGYFVPHEVMTGLRDDENVEILKGLKAGDKVVSSAAFLVDSEAKLKGVVPIHRH